MFCNFPFLKPYQKSNMGAFLTIYLIMPINKKISGGITILEFTNDLQQPVIFASWCIIIAVPVTQQ